MESRESDGWIQEQSVSRSYEQLRAEVTTDSTTRKHRPRGEYKGHVADDKVITGDHLKSYVTRKWGCVTRSGAETKKGRDMTKRNKRGRDRENKCEGKNKTLYSLSYRQTQGTEDIDHDSS